MVVNGSRLPGELMREGGRLVSNFTTRDRRWRPRKQKHDDDDDGGIEAD